MPDEWKHLSEAYAVFEETCKRQQLKLTRSMGRWEEKTANVLNEWVECGPWIDDSQLQDKIDHENLFSQIQAVWSQVVAPITAESGNDQIGVALSGRSFLATGRGGMAVFVVMMKWAFGFESRKPKAKQQLQEWSKLVAELTRVLKVLFKHKR